jgi:hypothetical protein
MSVWMIILSTFLTGPVSTLQTFAPSYQEVPVSTATVSLRPAVVFFSLQKNSGPAKSISDHADFACAHHAFEESVSTELSRLSASRLPKKLPTCLIAAVISSNPPNSDSIAVF